MFAFRNLDRVGYGYPAPVAVGAYGPQLVGAYGPQLVGQMMALPHGVPQGVLAHRGPAMAQHPGLPYGHAPGAFVHAPPMAIHPYSGQPQLVHNPPTQVREFIIGFGPTPVNANSTATFQAQPQLVFRGSRLIIPSTLANNFVVNDIRVGKDSQAVSANAIPAAAFSELGVGVALGLDTATPGILITLLVSNTTGGNQTFSAALIGTSMQ